MQAFSGPGLRVISLFSTWGRAALIIALYGMAVFSASKLGARADRAHLVH